MRNRFLVLVSLLLVAGFAFVASPWASEEPDGMARVAREEGFAPSEREHALQDSPVADYEVEGVEDEDLSTGLAGALGVLVTFVLTLSLVGGARYLRSRKQEVER